LPREIVYHDLEESEKICKCCGNDLIKIGEDKSEKLEYIPEQIKVIEHVSSKYTCRCCETIKMAEKPETPLAKSMAGASLIAAVITKKYEHHLPWYRQSKIFAQQGIDIPSNTLGNWFMQAGEILQPLNIVLWEQLNYTKLLQADETTVKVLLENIKGYMWCYHSFDPKNRFVIFEYNDSRSGAIVNNTLENYQGILQSDGYSGYNAMRTKSGVINIGCWAHCRRKFAEVVKMSTQTGKAHEMVSLIGKLYKVEDEAYNGPRNLDHWLRSKMRYNPP
jgi:transposase